MTKRRDHHTPAQPAATERKPPVLLLALGALALALVIGLIVALAGGDDDATVSGDDTVIAREDATFGRIEVEGSPLATHDSDAGDDEAIGQAAPVLRASTPEGAAITAGGSGQPTLITFLAHWCPHCQAELPLLVSMAEAGAFEGIRTVAVLTGTNPDAPNFPPVPWLDREGWTGDIALDDPQATAANAYGLTSYPFLVMVDADGTVVGRVSGEQPEAVVQSLIDAAVGAR